MIDRCLLAVAAAFVAVCASGWARTAKDPEVATPAGRLRGVLLSGGGAVFKGVPFAKPPVGPLRWREPQPMDRWNGVRDARSFGPGCMQAGGSIFSARDTTFSEDCLYLNIWNSEYPPRSRKPVMLWIHGGGNRNGDASQARFDGVKLARRGVVIVTTNFRLGAFGFFAHPALTRESPHRASGNQGLLDQVAALTWIRDSISAFGGDPSNVTLFGQSSGARDVSVLITSPLTKGLFRRAIVQSYAVGPTGGEAGPWSLAEAERLGEKLAAEIGVSGEVSVERLRAIPAANILKVNPASPQRYTSIIVDGYLVPGVPYQVFASGGQHRVELIVGNTTRDSVPTRAPLVDVKAELDKTYGAIADRAIALYGLSYGAQPNPDPLYGTPAEQWAADIQFRCPAVSQLIWHVSAGNRAYQYEFARVPRGREAVGATHSSDLPYLFGNFSAPGEFSTAVYDASDTPTSDAMQQYWTNFAKTGNPNAPPLPHWPAFETTSRPFLSFAQDGPRAGAGLRRPFCDLYLEYVRGFLRMR